MSELKQCRVCRETKPLPAYGFQVARTRTVCRACDSSRRAALHKRRRREAAGPLEALHEGAALAAAAEVAKLNAENQALRRRLS